MAGKFKIGIYWAGNALESPGKRVAKVFFEDLGGCRVKMQQQGPRIFLKEKVAQKRFC